MKLNKRFFYGVLAAVALLAAGCSKDNTDPVPDPGTGEQLVENPKVRAAVRTMMSEAARTESTLNGVAVWQEGYASSGEWPKGSENDTRRQMWSVTKTFTSMAVGIAVGQAEPVRKGRADVPRGSRRGGKEYDGRAEGKP